MLWRTAAIVLKRRTFSARGSLGKRPDFLENREIVLGDALVSHSNPSGTVTLGLVSALFPAQRARQKGKMCCVTRPLLNLLVRSRLNKSIGHEFKTFN